MNTEQKTPEEIIDAFADSRNRDVVFYEDFPSSIYKAVMRTFHPEIVRRYHITDIFNSKILRWQKRPFPLTDEQLKEFFE